MKVIISVLGLVLISTQLHASLWDILTAKKIDYQIGERWSKRVIERKNIQEFPPYIQKAAKGITRIGDGSGIYLGKLNGQHLLATNHHVCPNQKKCKKNKKVKFKLLNINAKVEKLVATWSDIDFTLLSLKVPSHDEMKLIPHALTFDFVEPPQKGMRLFSVGHGFVGFKQAVLRKLRVSDDHNCRIFSQTGDYRFSPDPDLFNPLDYKVWSLIHGCDTSHGDSGSPLIDYQTQKIVGLFWTGAYSKKENARVRSRHYLNELLNNNDERVWLELNYAIPSLKIRDILEESLTNSTLGSDEREIIQSLLSGVD